MKHFIDGSAFAFSIDGVRERYSEKDVFFDDIMRTHPKVNKAKLKKALEKVWSEAFPQVENG
jgi:hypothetical protein